MNKVTLQKVKMPLMNKLVRDWSKYQGTSLRKISLRMGRGETYLNKILRTNDIRPSLLIELSNWLNINLFEHYLALLPEHLRPTTREKELLKEIEVLKKELEQVKVERDRYWEVIAGKGDR